MCQWESTKDLCDSGNLKNVSSVLRHSNAEIQCVDYREILLKAETNDIVYFDPPYDPVNYTSDFTAYTPDGFGRENQEQLANVFGKLANRGCFVLLSNSDTPFIRKLYSDFSIKEVDVQRAINCKGSKRAGHKELLISNYSLPDELSNSKLTNRVQIQFCYTISGVGDTKSSISIRKRFQIAYLGWVVYQVAYVSRYTKLLWYYITNSLPSGYMLF
jgi:D12 class N6 adenine-specific DNA methyltransferase